MRIWSYLARALEVAPAVVKAIETEHANKDKETRTQMAQDALGIADEVAEFVLPVFQPEIKMANNIVAMAIAELQKLHAASNIPAPAAATT